MKKLLTLLLAVILVVTFGAFALGSGEDGESDQGSGNADTTDIGDYSVVIDSCRLAKDFEGDNVVIVKYKFTNNADDAAAFYLTFDDAVYQNGVGLNEAYVLKDSANYSADNQTKEIKKGATLDVEVAYELNDNTTDVEVEVKELFSFSDKTIKKTFKIKK
ncbi:MAG: DUF5067 domain-containing protein [Ruminococcaceae bacterium]|nr:DUF5067 domain-containing protein [Oscillospiraceae bacterium]